MKIFRCRLVFHTPAFLGDAERNGAWRTPAIKALLRQFWRMDYARRARWNVDVERMRTEEGALFGRACDQGNSIQSRVRIRLNRWDTGTLTNQKWGTKAINVNHPEVGHNGMPVDARLYLGYGPLTLAGRATQLKKSAAIQAGESATLSIAVPADMSTSIAAALSLANRFGTLGGRSRNGWGSFSLIPDPEGRPIPDSPGVVPVRDWRSALEHDWPHALGSDDKGCLMWATEPLPDWGSVMRVLAEVKIAFRTRLPFRNGKDSDRVEARHWLSYPVTNHSVQAWGGNLRLPNSLRFKVRQTTDNRLIGLAFHMPHRPPARFRPDDIAAVKAAWIEVHKSLDESRQIGRLSKMEELA